MDLSGDESISAVIRDRGATLKVRSEGGGGVGLTSDSIGGSLKHLLSLTLIILKKWGD